MAKKTSIKPGKRQKIRGLERKYSRLSARTSTIFAIVRKPLAILLILALAAADVFTMIELFGKLNTDSTQLWVYSLTFALCLEGIPTFMGNCVSQWFDQTKYKKNDRINAIVGTVVAAIGLAIAFAMAITLRGDLIESYGGVEAFRAGTYAAESTANWEPHLNSTYLKHRFLMYSPVVTSILAFVTSWVMFPSDNHARLERELDGLHAQLIDMQSEFLAARNTTEETRASLWKDLSGSDTNMPRSFNVFRKECYARIRELLFRDCLEKYPNQIASYNNAIVGELEIILQEMAKHTTIPEQIAAIDIQELLAQYDASVTNPIAKWNEEDCVTPLSDQLKRLLNNAIVVAQYQATSGSKRKEGSKW